MRMVTRNRRDIETDIGTGKNRKIRDIMFSPSYNIVLRGPLPSYIPSSSFKS